MALMQMNIIFCGFDESISLVNRWIRNVNVTPLHTLLNISQFSLILLLMFFFQASEDHDYCGKRRYMVQNTKKCNCTAQIHMREIIVYPTYKVWDQIVTVQQQ